MARPRGRGDLVIRGIFSDGPWNERARLEEARKGRPVVASMLMPDLHLSDMDRAVLAGHLRDSATMTEAGYKAGNFNQRVEQILDMIHVIATAAGSERPVNVSINLDSRQCRIVRAVLLASRERAGDLRGCRDAISAIIAAWERVTSYDARAERLEAQRAPAEASDEGGWRPVA